MSIADLMSGFVVVLLILFATAAALPHFQKPPLPPALTAEQIRANARDARHRKFLANLSSGLEKYARQGMVKVDVESGVIEFAGDVSYGKGIACLTTDAKKAVSAVAPTIAAELANDPELIVHIEGHTDPEKVQHPRSACGLFADNMQLSALRAANVRELIASQIAPELLARISVTGWGPDRLRNRVDTNASENRRVELHIEWRPDASTGASGMEPLCAAAEVSSAQDAGGDAGL